MIIGLLIIISSGQGNLAIFQVSTLDILISIIYDVFIIYHIQCDNDDVHIP